MLESSRLDEYDWLPTRDGFADYYQENYGRWWNLVMQRFQDLVPAGVPEVAELIGRRIVNIKHRMAEPPQTLVHGDYRLDNLIFRNSEPALTLTVIDWGEVWRGRGLYDVAYFLAGSMRTEQRRSQEMALLRRYHTQLWEGGVRDYDFDRCVRDYDFDRCVRDYRLALLDVVCFYTEVGATQDLSGVPGVLFTETAFPRLFAAVLDLNIVELLQDL